MQNMQIESKKMDNQYSEEELRKLVEYYKDSYEQEKKKSDVLAGRLSDAESKASELEYKLGRIKNNPVWKVSKPFRIMMHFIIRTKDRIIRLGNPKGILRKIKSKWIEHKAMKKHGQKSFPDEITSK